MSSLSLADTQQTVSDLIEFIRGTFKQQNFTQAVVAVSGGIDSAVATSLLVKALGPTNVFTLLMPYADQSMVDAKTLLSELAIPLSNQKTIEITSIVDAVCHQVGLDQQDTNLNSRIRLANLMARSRMILVYDWAKELSALVCGTENKSEHYLGYFTRFGDAASDLEPLHWLYKTQVRAVAAALEMPAIFLQKPPSAGLWAGQTDEQELGFSYELADQVLFQLIDLHQTESEILADFQTHQSALVPQVKAVMARVQAQKFKLLVPYLPEKP